MPRAGGPYAFVSRAFGPFAGTMIGWSDWLNYVVANGFLGVVFAEYVHRLGFLESVPIGVLAVGLIAATWALNALGTRTSGTPQVALAVTVLGSAVCASTGVYET